MKLERIQTIQRLPIDVEEAWNFFTNPKNLALIVPPSLDYRLTGASSEYLHPGSIYSAQVRPFPGITVSWVTQVTYIRPPGFFISEQLTGPFRLWHHEHHMREHKDGVELEDIVLYGLPLGWIGSFIHDVYLKKHLHEVFMHRARSLESRFGSIQRRKRPQQIAPPEQIQKPQPQRHATSHPPPKPSAPPGADSRGVPPSKKTITLDDIFSGTSDD